MGNKTNGQYPISAIFMDECKILKNKKNVFFIYLFIHFVDLFEPFYYAYHHFCFYWAVVDFKYSFNMKSH